MHRQHHPAVQVLLWLLTLACAAYAVMGTGFSAIIAAIFVVALRVEANTGGFDSIAGERERQAAAEKYARELAEYEVANRAEEIAAGRHAPSAEDTAERERQRLESLRKAGFGGE